ncbi:hypothetical protein [Pseudoxanthomonas putridarboris]|uniref:Uncharacterized protein n=1 Tax=Pseudoxanthomonas putridarboris TaxID=752605 RepID=A0ABU9J1V9_9GAMM
MQRTPEAWLRQASVAFIVASTLVTLTAVGFALGLLSLPAVVVAVLLAAGAMAYGLYARRRAS